MTQSPTKAGADGMAPGAGPKASRRAFLSGGALVIAGGIAGGWWWRRQAPDHDRLRLSPAEAFQQVQAGQVHLIDIRTPREWRITGVPTGATPLDMRRRDFLPALDQILGGDRQAPVALICARGVRSARMTIALAEAGFVNVIDVPEGMLGSGAGPGWIAGNLPVTRWGG